MSGCGRLPIACRSSAGLFSLTWAREPAPLLPRYDLFVWENCLRDIGQRRPALQLAADHGEQRRSPPPRMAARPSPGRRQRTSGESTPTHYPRRHKKTGFDVFRHGIIKRRVLENGTEDDDDWKVGHPLIFPVMLKVGSGNQHRMQIRVPIDDTHTWHLWYSCYRPASADREVSQSEIPLYDVPWRNADGTHKVDTVDGQDIMACVTQGQVVDRTREILGSSDEGIALLRRLLLQQLEVIRLGEDPLGVIRDADENRIVELPQEANKYGSGTAFLAESLKMSHARYSPLWREILELLGVDDGQST